MRKTRWLKTILIAGASAGNGAETARCLAPENELSLHYNALKEVAEKVAGVFPQQKRDERKWIHLRLP